MFYSGKVQGVGFRMNAQYISHRLGITGWVKNLPNGQVEIIAEADEERINSFLQEMKQSFSVYIENVDITWEEPTNEFTVFGVRF